MTNKLTLVKHFEGYSVDEKLTVESVVEKIIWNEIVTGSSGTKDNTKAAKELMKVFLEQIRNEIIESLISDKYGVHSINEVFNNYLNEK